MRAKSSEWRSSCCWTGQLVSETQIVCHAVSKGECSFPCSPQWAIVLLLCFRPRKVMYSLNGSNCVTESTKYLCRIKRRDGWLSCLQFDLRERVLGRDVCWQLLNKQKICSPAEIPWAGSAWRLEECLGTVDKLALFFFFPGYWLLSLLEPRSWAKWSLDLGLNESCIILSTAARKFWMCSC